MAEFFPQKAGWILDHLPFPLTHFDAQGTITYCNPPAARLLGCAPAELMGASAASTLADNPELLRVINQVLASGQPHVVRMAFPDRNESRVVRHYETRFEPELNEQGMVQGVLMASEDITGWQESEARRQRLERSQAFGEALNRINGLIHSVLNFDDIMRQVCVEAAEVIGAESAVIYVREPHEWVARYTYGRLNVINGQRFSDEELRDSIRVIRESQTILINDAINDPDVNRALVEHHGVRAVLDGALRMADRPVGDFGLYYHSPGKRFGEADKAFLDKVGASVGLALQNAERFTKLRQTEAALRNSEARHRREATELEVIYQQAPIGLLVFDRELRFKRINNYLAQMNGLPVEAHLGKTPREVLPNLADVAEALAQQVFTTGEPVINYEVRGETPAQPGVERIWTEHWLPLKDEQGQVWGINVVAEEITERKRIEQALRESESRFRTLADNISQLAWMADPSGARFWYNRRWFEYSGTTPEEMQGWGWQKVHHPEGVQRIVETYRHAVETGEPWEGTFRLRAQYGTYRWFLTRAMPIRDEQGQVVRWFGTDTDITERKQMEEHAQHMAQHDALTGLPNRRLLLELLDTELRKARRSYNKVALLFLDLDRFKTINDTLSHEAGDELLKEVAQRISSRVRRSDTVARLGGDEFTVLLPDLGQGDYAREVAEAIIKTFDWPFRLAGNQMFYATTSIGISLYPDDDDTAEGLLRRADLAMYDAKKEGRNTYRFYNPVLDHRSQERSYIGNHLRESLEGGGLSVLYQPEIDLRTGKTVGVEALLRWHHPKLGRLDPTRFIPIAEETDLIILLDDWVLRTACAQARQWLDQGLSSIRIGVNLSAKRFESPDLVKSVRRVLAEYQLSAEHLELELTESTIMHHVDQAVGRMRELSAMGVCIAIDDFGTGYSSLNYLKRLPISKLKIDRSFIRDITTDADDRAIIHAVTALAHTLNKRVIAEGVETEEQRDFLNATGCDEAQGYLFTEPLSADQFRERFLH